MGNKEQEQPMREWLHRKRSELIVKFCGWQVGEITSDEYNKYASKFVSDILAEFNRRMDEAKLTEAQIDAITVTGKELDEYIKALRDEITSLFAPEIITLAAISVINKRNTAAAQLAAVKEKVNGK